MSSHKILMNINNVMFPAFWCHRNQEQKLRSKDTRSCYVQIRYGVQTTLTYECNPYIFYGCPGAFKHLPVSTYPITVVGDSQASLAWMQTSRLLHPRRPSEIQGLQGLATIGHLQNSTDIYYQTYQGLFSLTMLIMTMHLGLECRASRELWLLHFYSNCYLNLRSTWKLGRRGILICFSAIWPRLHQTFGEWTFGTFVFGTLRSNDTSRLTMIENLRFWDRDNRQRSQTFSEWLSSFSWILGCREKS